KIELVRTTKRAPMWKNLIFRIFPSDENPCTSFAAGREASRHSKRLSREGAGEVRRHPKGMPPGRMSRPCEASAGTQDPEAGRSWKAQRIFMLLLSAKSSRRQPGL